MRKQTTKNLTLAGILIAVSVVCSPLSIPVGAAKCFPVQHLVNIVSAVILGPYYGVIMAFITSCIRVAAGTGTLLAFPGSMFGALTCGIVYKLSKNIPAACVGELFGTSVIGGLAAYPVAVFVMGKTAALFGYVLPFFVSSAGGTIIAAVLLCALKKTKVLDKI